MRMIDIWSCKRLPILAGVLIVSYSVTFAAASTEAPRRDRPPRTLGLAAPGPASASHPEVVASYGRLPLHFEPNLKQTTGEVRFLARGGGMMAFFTETETVMVLGRGKQAVVRMRLEKAGMPRRIAGVEKLPGISNYFIGNNPARWRTDVPHYARLQYEGVYPGIDLVWYGNQRRLEYDFVVAPGADARQIQVAYEGLESLKVTDGDLILRTAVGEVRQRKPRVYQDIGGQRVEVGARYTIMSRNRVAFELAKYDRRRALRIDPVLVYSTYLGGSLYDEGIGIALDGAGSAYVTGNTQSIDFPIQSGFQTAFQGGDYDVFVTKLTPSGSGLVYSTYLGGSGDDVGNGIAVDGSGSAYVTGETWSSDFPTQSAFQVFQGRSDAFVTKLTPAGNALAYSTYLGGTDYDGANGIAVDAAGSAYVTGNTYSANFPMQSPYQSTFYGDDAFVTKLSPSGTTLVYSTYLGGTGFDQGNGIVVDALGSAYVTGSTASIDFPVLSAYQPSFQGGQDAFVTKFSPSGAAVVYSTYLGGSDYDQGYGIALDGAGSAYVTGSTASTDFPTQPVAYQAIYPGGNYDAFVTKLTPAGNGLVYSTYLGGSNADVGYGIAVDGAGSAYVAGFSASADFPTQSPLQPALQGGSDAFVTKLTPAGDGLVCSTHLGGTDYDQGNGIAIDGSGSAYVTGYTRSADFPTQSSYQPAFQGGSSDAFVSKISLGTASAALSILKSHSGNFTQGQSAASYSVLVSNASNAGPTSGTVTVTETVPSGLTLVSMSGNGWSCASNTCTRSDVLAAGASYAPIIVTVNVASSAVSPQVNSVSVSGGNSAPAITVDSTVIVANSPALSVGKTHLGTFTQGQTGATYTVVVSNASGALTTSGTVTVIETIPSGLTLVSMSGTGWNCSGSACTRSDALAGGASYPLITVTVNVAANAASQVANQVAVSGGGSAAATASDSTSVVPAGAPGVGLSSPSGGGAVQTFTGTYSDPNGYNDIRWVQMLVAAAPDGGGQTFCFVHYDVLGKAFWLYGDGGFFLGPVSPGTASNRLENSLCALNTSASSASGLGATLTLNANVVFKAAGARNIYLRAENLAGRDSGWIPVGTWTMAAAALGTMVANPSSGSSSQGLPQTFTLTYPDPSGFAGAAFGWVQFLVAAATNGGGQPFCFLHYDRAGNALWMYSSDAGFFLGPVTPGTASTVLTSSACSVNTAGATATNAAGNLVLTVPITLKTPMVAAKNLYLRTLDVLNRDTGFQQSGTWTIQ
jgi:uncharacterized repeat protein (TIGR01451 family)